MTDQNPDDRFDAWARLARVDQELEQRDRAAAIAQAEWEEELLEQNEFVVPESAEQFPIRPAPRLAAEAAYTEAEADDWWTRHTGALPTITSTSARTGRGDQILFWVALIAVFVLGVSLSADNVHLYHRTSSQQTQLDHLQQQLTSTCDVLKLEGQIPAEACK